MSVLRRRVATHVRKTGEPAPIDVEAMIASVVEALVAAGLVDDRRIAESKTRSMRSRGKSARAVRTTLRMKGVDVATVDAVLRAEKDVDGTTRTPAEAELDAARALVRRKKIGAMRDASTPEVHQKDLATIARAGFAYDVARRALASPEDD